jgi:predicted enzyme related to lactoylglutathione lyase/catechol 2,3-dioxygenase-like lactoylglutathione lyase family enzyme
MIRRRDACGGAECAAKTGFASKPSRRAFVASLGACACTPFTSRSVFAQAPALPLDNLGLEHLDILVPDTAQSARFYMQVFDTALHQQPFRGSIRYFILLGDLPADRQVGYIAIGAAGERPVQVGHYCALAETYDRAGVAAALETAGYPAPAGGFGMIPDPDGIELQLFTLPAGLVAAAVPSDLPVESNGLVHPLGMDNVLLRVADMERSLDYYRFVYGSGLEVPDAENPDRVWFQLERDTRLGLEPVLSGTMPGIARFGVKVGPFDPVAVSGALRELGAEVLAVTSAPDLIRFRDNYGITLEVVA